MFEKFCPECLDYTVCEPVKNEKTYEVKGEKITIMAQFLKCQECQEIIPDKEMQDRNFTNVYSEYRKRKKLLEPSEIEAIRSKYDLSQRQFAKILGWSHATLSRYESGALQSVNHNNELVLLQNDPHNMMKLLEVNSDNLLDSEVAAIRKKIIKVIEDNKAKSFKDLLFSYLRFEEPSIFNGYKKFDLDKLINTIRFFAINDPQLYKVKLMKYLFYSDFLFFKRYTKSINGLKYVNYQMGPVPDDYETLLLCVVGEDTEIRKEYVYFSSGYGELFKANSCYEEIEVAFSPEELDTLRCVLEYLRPHTSTSVSELSHQEDAWKLTSDRERISYEHAMTLSIN